MESTRVDSDGVCAPSEIAAQHSSNTAKQRIRILWVGREAMVIMSQ
jgi:hypothetical protein